MNIQNIPKDSGAMVPKREIRRCFRTVTTDGTEYIAEFDDTSTAAVRHTMTRPDGTQQQWGHDFTRV